MQDERFTMHKVRGGWLVTDRKRPEAATFVSGDERALMDTIASMLGAQCASSRRGAGDDG